MIYGKPIEKPPAAFEPGDLVKFRFEEDIQEFPGSYRVIASGVTHTKIEGRYYAVFNWQLKRVRKSSSSIAL